MKKHNNKTRIKKKKSSILIRVIKKNKNSPKESRERERERAHSFCMRKIWIEWEKWYQIYTNKIKRIRVKL